MSRRRGVSDRIVTMPFKHYTMPLIVSGTSSLIYPLRPDFGRLSVVSPAFEFYRFTKLRVELPPTQNVNAADATDQPTVAVCYFPEIVDVTTTTMNIYTVLEQLRSTYQVLQQSDVSNGLITGSTIYRRFSVPKRELLSLPLKWYPVVASSENLDYIQGSLVIATSSTPPFGGQPVLYTLVGEIEFRGFAETTITIPRPVASDEDEKHDGVVVLRPPLLKPSSLSRRPRV
jgi:hypothetical protein